MVSNSNQNQFLSHNSGIQEVIEWLLSENFPPLPVAPKQDPREYHKVEKADEEKQVGKYCPLDQELQPIPLFTGKNPSFLDGQGIPHVVFHQQYQSRLPSEPEIKEWFAHPANGIGTLGGINGAIWIDFDVN